MKINDLPIAYTTNRYYIYIMFIEQIPLKKNDYFILRYSNLKVNYPFHQHSEFELILVNNIDGKRIVGDNISEFKKSDLVLIGPNLPHMWRFEKIQKNSYAAVLQFKVELIENEIIKNYISEKLQKLIQLSSAGISIRTQIIPKVSQLLKKIESASNLEKLQTFLSLLNLIGNNFDKALSTKGFSVLPQGDSKDKINAIYTKILRTYNSDISIESLATEFHYSKSGFCSYFKRRTGKNFSDFINELRIGNACKLLIETDMSITEICYETGFRNLSYFNRRFKEIIGRSPKEYKRLVNL